MLPSFLKIKAHIFQSGIQVFSQSDAKQPASINPCYLCTLILESTQAKLNVDPVCKLMLLLCKHMFMMFPACQKSLIQPSVHV